MCAALLALASSVAATDPSTRPPLIIDLGNGVAMTLAWVPPGTFMMGADTEQPDEAPVRAVTLTSGYWLGVYEVTQEQWARLSDFNPSRFPGPSRPVENVTWKDCDAWLRRFNHALAAQLPEGSVARLPTEAEWVYACHAGTTSAYGFGDTPGDLHRFGNYADADETEPLSWRDTERHDGFAGTAPVGSFPANAWGFHDMHGNVWEWCMDWYGPFDPTQTVNPTGPRHGRRRVIRGGSWGDVAADCRAHNRYRFKPEAPGGNVGFRILISARPQ